MQSVNVVGRTTSGIEIIVSGKTKWRLERKQSVSGYMSVAFCILFEMRNIQEHCRSKTEHHLTHTTASIKGTLEDVMFILTANISEKFTKRIANQKECTPKEMPSLWEYFL